MAGKLHWAHPVSRQRIRSWCTLVGRAQHSRLTKALGLMAGLGMLNGALPTRAQAQCNPAGTAVTLDYSTRAAGEDWRNRSSAGVPSASSFTQASTTYTSSDNNSTLVTGSLNGNTLVWTATEPDKNATTNSKVVYTFSRPVSSVSIRVRDIDANFVAAGVLNGLVTPSHGFNDQVTFTGANNGTAVTPTLTKANANSAFVSVSGNVATGSETAGNTDSPVDGTVTATYPSPITSLTVTYRNVTTATNLDQQAIGIDQISWCRVVPTANAVTTTTVPNTATQVGIASLSGTADGTVTSYTITSLPANGTLYYNSTGTTYAAVTANTVLMPAQAASLRYTPAASYTGTSTTFTYQVKDDAGLASTNTATYTIPLANTTCTTATATLDLSTRPASEDWKAHAALAVPAGSPATSVSTSGYTTPGTATTSTLSTAQFNGVQTLQWVTDYANQTDNTSSVTFNFTRPVSNFVVRVQDIDRVEDGTSAFFDQVTFAGANGSTAVLPVLGPAKADNNNSVIISGNTATGTVNNTDVNNATVLAYFASPITSLTLTYRNLSTAQANPTTNAVGIDLLSFCRLAPVAANITNPSRPGGQGVSPVNALSATADGTVASYTVSGLNTAQGTFYVNGVVLNTTNFPGLVLTPTQASQLSFAPAAGFSGNAGFSYTATDDASVVSNTATYTVPVTATGGSGTPAPCATAGKDGSPTLTSNPNTYYPGTASASAGATSLTVGTGTTGGAAAASTITAGDLLLVIQMQGADINSSNTDSYGDGVAGGGANGNLTTNYQAGTYEYVVASSSLSGNTIALASALKNSYVSAAATTSAGPRTFQVVRVPQYANLTLGASLAATAWNGSIGGLLVLDVAGRLNMAGYTIDASGRGFRGGGGRTQTANSASNLNDYVNLISNGDQNAQKGEGTAGTPRFVNSPSTINDATTNATIDLNVVGYPGGTSGRGAPGNAGGGGNDNINNSGGGGGANGSVGGRGGNNFSSSLAIGGEPGAYFAPVSSSRLVLGGGGGAGSTNNATGTPANGYASSGAAGGGIVMLRTGTVSGTGTILANGGNANNSVADDGSGGGGAGGSILVTASQPAGLSNLTLSANGGKGGTNTGGTSGNHGPGGGGGGGVILTSGSVAAATVTAGASGTTKDGTAFGAAAGLGGVSNTGVSNSIANSTSGANCAADVTVALNGPTTLNAGQPTGTFTATFTNEGPSPATSVSRTVTLPAGATVTAAQLAVIRSANPSVTNLTYDPATNKLDFGSLASLASDANSVVMFAFTAPTATGSSTLTGNTSTTAGEGSNTAPNQTTLTLNTVTTADVVAAITASSTATTGTFNVTFSNNGPQSAAGVVRTVQLPAGLTGVTVTGGGTYDATTGLVSYSPSPTSIASGSPLTSAISYSLASSSTPVAATATVSTTTNEAGQTANNTATALMPASFDLATTLTGPTTAIAGAPTTLYVTTTNNGPNAAPSANQTVIIPSDNPLTNVYITNGGTYTYNTTTKQGTVTFPSVANLPAGQTIANSISFSAPTTSTGTPINFAPSATVAGAGGSTSGDTNTANNTAYLNGSATSTQVAETPATANQSNEATTIVADKMIVSAGTVVTYTVTATNKGYLNTPSVANVAEQVQLIPGLTPATLTVGGTTGTVVNGVIRFVTPAGTTTYDPATGIVTYPVLTSQASGSTFTFDKLAVTVPANTGNDGQLLATASVSTALSDPVPSDNTSSVVVKVQTTADLATTLTGPTAATAGQLASYTATFANGGAGSATNVVETVQLPAGLSNVLVQDASGNVVNNAYNAATGLVTLPATGSLAAGANQVYGISFTAPAQSYPLTSSISSGTTDPTTTNNTALLRTTVSPTADVAVYVSGPATAVAGNAVTYALTVANNGPSPASAVQATMQLPAGLTGSATPSTNPDNSSNNGVTVTGGGYYNATTGVVTFPSVNLVAGDSRVGLVTFTMPANSSNGQVGGSASVTTTSTDVVAGNNTAAITTDIAPATSDMADLITSITAPTSSVAAGSAISYTLNFSNNGPAAAVKVMPTAYLLAGLSNVVVRDASGNVVPNAYNSATGQITLPTIDSQASGNLTTYTVNLTAPANAVSITASSVSSNTSDPTPGNNVASNRLTITPVYDVVTSLAGPTSAQPGSVNTYTLTTTNNGPSTSSATANSTTQSVTVPAGSVVGGLPTGASYNSGTGVITFPAISSQAAGPNGAVSNTFTVQMPASGSLGLTATITAAGESNTDNDQATLTTAPANQAPVAQNVWNTLRSARGNSATSLPISPLYATDADGTVNSYKVTSLPTAAQGVLYLASGAAVAVGQTVPANGLYFAPSPSYVGNATFTYQAVDNAAATSNQALYTIAVAQDQVAAYTAYNSGKPATAYAAYDVLAQTVDPNAAAYNGTGVIYDATTGVEQAGTTNGVASAALASGTLPAGTALRTTTITDANGIIRPAGEIYVADPSQLPKLAQATTYTVQITVTDLNGGVSTIPVSFTLGATPLPVSLVAFTAQAVQNRDALLSWTTASELNNARFEVERSLDGTSFVKVGEVAGQSTKATATQYAFTDAGVAARTQGLVYYRLRQVDVAGTAAYSPVRTASFTKAIASLVALYPNPAATATSLDLSALPAGNTYQVLLLDVTGRQVQAATLAGGQPQPLNLSNLATGTYHVVVTGTQADGSALRQTLRLTKE